MHRQISNESATVARAAPAAKGRLVVMFCMLAAAGAASTPVQAQNYRLERIASGLNQPTYVTQAPGDPSNILYYTERTSNTIGGFGAVNQMGKVWRYDVDTRAKTLVLDLSGRQVTNDDGLETIAFSPDFNTVGAPTYHKMYVSSAQYPGGGQNANDRVEEYTMQAGGTFGSARTILQYTNNTQNNHTVDWIGFDPNATGIAKSYLYISTGDSSFGNSYNGGTSPTGRPSQNPTDVRGKILRVDVSGGDDYPSTSKNFAIPPSNPIPTYNAANPGSPINGVGEVYVTGVRNGYRVSFDRATSDMYWGDVGENSVEEVDFLKAGSNANGPPVDYGWPQKEGTNFSGVSGAPNTTTNPFTGVSSLYPLQQFTHTGGGNAVIGGYVYHGPISDLQGKYFYADFVRPGKSWMLDFDRNTPSSAFNGNNGTLTEVTSLWQSLVFDPTDPSYTPSSSIDDVNGIDHIVSFGEDNEGNMYIVDFGNHTVGQSNFDGQYPNAGLGEIFKLVPSIPRSDLNLDGVVDANDWIIFRTYNLTDLTGLTPAEQHNRGDLNGDGLNDVYDFRIFKTDFDAANGVGAFAADFGNVHVPEPADWVLTLCGLATVAAAAKPRRLLRQR